MPKTKKYEYNLCPLPCKKEQADRIREYCRNKETKIYVQVSRIIEKFLSEEVRP